LLGLINARVISKGRQGRMREIRLAIPDNIFKKSEQILLDALGI
jgi:Cdc6-like AAA superfamily ATPase